MKHYKKKFILTEEFIRSIMEEPLETDYQKVLDNLGNKTEEIIRILDTLRNK